MLHFILEKFSHESYTAGDLLVYFTSFSFNATKKVWHIHIEKYIFQQWIYNLFHNLLAIEYFKYITVFSMLSQQWEQLQSFTFQRDFPSAFPLMPPTLPLPSAVLFKLFLFILFLQFLLLVKRFTYGTCHRDITWKEHNRVFTGLKFSLEYANIHILVLIVYFAFSMTAGQLASSLSFFIKHMPTATWNCSELHKCMPLRLKLPVSSAIRNHCNFFIHTSSAKPGGSSKLCPWS